MELKPMSFDVGSEITLSFSTKNENGIILFGRGGVTSMTQGLTPVHIPRRSRRQTGEVRAHLTHLTHTSHTPQTNTALAFSTSCFQSYQICIISLGNRSLGRGSFNLKLLLNSIHCERDQFKWIILLNIDCLLNLFQMCLRLCVVLRNPTFSRRLQAQTHMRL